MSRIREILQPQNVLSAMPVILALLLVGTMCVNYIFPQHQTWIQSLIESLKSLQPEKIGNTSYYDTIIRATTFKQYTIWQLFTGLYLVTCILALVIGASIIWLSSSKRNIKFLIISLLGFVGITVVFHLFQVKFASDLCVSTDFWSQFVCYTMGKEVVEDFGRKHLWLDALGIGTVGFLAVASSAILFYKPQAQDPIKNIFTQMKWLRLILYVGSALLITSTLRVSALFHWALAFLQLPPSLLESKDGAFINKTINDVISNMITNLGIGYSLLLIVIYIPSALILNHRASKLMEENELKNTNGEQVKMNLTLPLYEQLMRLAAIMGPFLAGPVGELLNRLK